MLWIGSKGLTFWLPLSLTRGLPVGVGWDAGSTSRTISLGMVHVTSLLVLYMGLKGLTFWLPLSLTRGLPVRVGWDAGATRRSCVTASFLFQCLCSFTGSDAALRVYLLTPKPLARWSVPLWLRCVFVSSHWHADTHYWFLLSPRHLWYSWLSPPVHNTVVANFYIYLSWTVVSTNSKYDLFERLTSVLAFLCYLSNRTTRYENYHNVVTFCRP